MTPFNYPPEPQIRRHGPKGYAGYESFRPWLRDEFSFRCVYCLRREQWGRVQSEFVLDHFLAVASHPDLATAYDNLVYACSTCNAAKNKLALPDPCKVLNASAVTVAADGTLQIRTRDALRLIRKLGLDERPATEFRALWLGITRLAKQYDPVLYRRLLGYPDDLPDLSRLRPPGGNTRPDGIEASFFRMRQQGELPATY